MNYYSNPNNYKCCEFCGAKSLFIKPHCFIRCRNCKVTIRFADDNIISYKFDYNDMENTKLYSIEIDKLNNTTDVFLTVYDSYNSKFIKLLSVGTAIELTPDTVENFINNKLKTYIVFS